MLPVGKLKEENIRVITFEFLVSYEYRMCVENIIFLTTAQA
jgi:hypothetical protein